MSVTSPTTQEMGPCPCRRELDDHGVPTGYGSVCNVVGTKLTVFGHLVGCTCRPCLGRRNRRKGQKAEARAHKRLGGTGRTVRDDLFHLYSLNHSVETKSGRRIPASIKDFAGSEWFRHALAQAEKKTPVGSDALPSVLIELSPSRAYLVTNVSGRSLRG